MSGRYSDRQTEREVIVSFIQNVQRSELPDAQQEIELMVDGRLEGEKVCCPVRIVSEIIREYGVERIDLLKVDVERSELEVLHGIAEDDWHKIRQIVLEVEDSDDRLERIITLLETQAYRVAVEQDSLWQGTAIYNVYASRLLSATHLASIASPELTYPAPLSGEELRLFVGERLPEYMLPSTFVLLDALPLLPNGKLDRKALPPPEMVKATRDGSAGKPRNPVEQALVEIWTDVLSLTPIGIHDDFFELGGHSLLAVQLITRIDDAFHISLPLQVLFEAPNVAALATAIDAVRWTEAGKAREFSTNGGDYEDFKV